jgi:hypothetical protein
MLLLSTWLHWYVNTQHTLHSWNSYKTDKSAALILIWNLILLSKLQSRYIFICYWCQSTLHQVQHFTCDYVVVSLPTEPCLAAMCALWIRLAHQLSLPVLRCTVIGKRWHLAHIACETLRFWSVACHNCQRITAVITYMRATVDAHTVQ